MNCDKFDGVANRYVGILENSLCLDGYRIKNSAIPGLEQTDAEDAY